MLFKLKHPKISQPPNRQNEQSTVRRKGLPETALEEKPETPSSEASLVKVSSQPGENGKQK